MSACEQCGDENAFGTDFCGSCGAFLEWTDAGEAVLRATTPAPVERPDAAAGADIASRGAPDTDEVPVPVPRPGEVLGGEKDNPATSAGRPGAFPRPAAQTRPAVVPARPASTQTPPASVQARPASADTDRPPAPPRPQAHPPPPSAPEGSVVCATCRRANPPDRRFCPACGTNLALRPPPARPAPWWARLRQGWLSGARAQPQASARSGRAPGVRSRWGRARWGRVPAGSAGPGGRASGREVVAQARRARSRARGSVAKVRRVLGMVGLLSVVLAVAGPWRASISDRAGDLFASVRRAVSPQIEPVRPVAVSASSEVAGHPATAAFDGASNTHWSEAEDGDGEGATLELELDPPVDLGRIGITSGDQSSVTSFAAQPRPRTIEVTAGESTTEITLQDTADFQSHSVKVSDATRVTIRVTSVYPSPGGDDLSVAEIELFAIR